MRIGAKLITASALDSMLSSLKVKVKGKVSPRDKVGVCANGWTTDEELTDNWKTQCLCCLLLAKAQ